MAQGSGPRYGEVTVFMDAPLTAVWDAVSDVTRIGEFSPETFEAEWLDGATGPAVGNRFRGHVNRNQSGVTYWSTCVVTDCERNRVFAFDVLAAGRPANHWRYDLEAADGGTQVTESFRLPSTLLSRIYWAVAGRWRSKTNRAGMEATLARIRDVVEQV